MYRRLAIPFFSEFRPESFPGQAGDCAAVHRDREHRTCNDGRGVRRNAWL